MTRREARIWLALWAAFWFGVAMIFSTWLLLGHRQPPPSPPPAPRITHASTTVTAHQPATSSYNWPQAGVIQQGPDCLAAASVTFLETYGLHVSQFTFAPQDPGANTDHAAVIINGYLRRYHVHVTTTGRMNAVQLATLLAFSRRPVLATLWSGYLPEWLPYWPGAHEVMLWRLTTSGEIRFWDPAFGWEVTTIPDIAAATWEYIIPAPA